MRTVWHFFFLYLCYFIQMVDIFLFLENKKARNIALSFMEYVKIWLEKRCTFTIRQERRKS